MGTIVTLILWAAFACCALLAASGFWQMARSCTGWRYAGNWHAPLIFTSASVALLAFLGALPPGPGTVLALLPLLPPAAIAWNPWRSAAKSMGWPHATAFILGRFLAFPLRNALRYTWEDLRALVGSPPAVPAPDAGGGPVPVIARPRRIPSTSLPDLALGPAPVPEQVAAELEAAGVAVPACWAAVAEWEASFEPEDGEDLRQHIAERAAGILTVAEAAGGNAEDLATGLKLDPAFIAAETDFADDFADTASAAAMSLRVYDAAYEGVHEHADNGGTLPENARQWFGAGGPEGQAA